jgi:hypothetical protein
MPAEGLAARLRRWVAGIARLSAQAAEHRARTRFSAQHYAAERARALLLDCLSAAQRAEFQRTLGFRVRGASGRSYRIGYSATANIEVLDETGEVQYRLCAGPERVPTAAVLLAQKLMLEASEAEFLRIAARHPAVIAPFVSRRASQFGVESAW